jgi:hypothetical protein
MLRAALCALVLVLLGTFASADPVRAIEQSARRLAKTRMASKDVPVVTTKKLTVWLRPGAGVVGVSKNGFFSSQHGLTLGAEGRLSPADHATLTTLLQKHAPGTTATTIHQAVRTAIGDFRQREKVLRAEDATINDLLVRARAVRGRHDTVVWEGRRGRLVFRPSANVLVGETRTGQQGFFLDNPASMKSLREFLHDRR